jgi:hypothetical protein
MNITSSRVFAVFMLPVAFALAGCSTTKPIVNEWSNPGYISSSFERIMVGGADEKTSIRRNFEDEFVAQLRAAGVDALPSYRHIPEDQNINEVSINQAAKGAGADAVILTRAINVERKTEYGPSYYPGTSFGIFGSNVGATWSGLYGAPNIRHYQMYTSETTLYDVAKNDVVWTGTVQTIQPENPENVNTAIKSYVEAVVKALNEKNLLRIKKPGQAG